MVARWVHQQKRPIPILDGASGAGDGSPDTRPPRPGSLQVKQATCMARPVPPPGGARAA
jgi:hypothetical protein